ncbi:MAG: hypothetical protein ACEQSL_01565 [Sediminibacterium sp.]
MSVCNPATETAPIPVCTGVLSIGIISDINQAVKVFIEDITTGRTEEYNRTSSNTGTVTVDLSDAEVSDTHSYQLWVEKINTQNVYDIIVGITTAKYYQLKFFSAMADGQCFEMVAVTLETA